MDLPLSYVPWSMIKSWRCIRCGACCARYDVPLLAWEYAEITSRFGSGIVEIGPGRAYLRKVKGGCIFQSGNLCSLHELGLKPLACRLYPFTIRTKAKRRDALFRYKSWDFYVFIHPLCRGLTLGIPGKELVEKLIPGAIELTLKPSPPASSPCADYKLRGNPSPRSSSDL